MLLTCKIEHSDVDTLFIKNTKLISLIYYTFFHEFSIH